MRERHTPGSGWRRRALPMLIGTLLILLLAAPAALAAETEQGEVAPVGQEDDPTGDATSRAVNAWELGVHGTAADLPTATAAERDGMWYWLNGWFVRNYNFNESSAWERDFKRESLGGTNNYYIDAVDLQFYVGHGSPGLFTFANKNYNDGTLYAYQDCDDAWGEVDNEWFALTSCQVLSSSNDGMGRMARCMNGNHLILGFVTNASAHNAYYNTQAYWFGLYMRVGYNMTQSWFKACDVAQRNRVARIIGEDDSCFNDNPYTGASCPDTDGSGYWYWTHNCGTETARPVTVDGITQLPRLVFQPYSLDDANRDQERLSGVFGVPISSTLRLAGPLQDGGNPPGAPSEADSPLLLAGSTAGAVLEKSKASNIYQYTDASQLFNADIIPPALAVSAASPNYISQDDARTIADRFLSQNNLMPQDAQWYETVADNVGNLPENVITSAEVVEAADNPVMWKVGYSRIINVAAVTVAGTQQVTISVVGPGAKQQVYVPIAAPVGVADILQTPPSGVQGGWRPILGQAVTAAGELIYDEVIDFEQVKALYLAMDKEVTKNSIPLDVISRKVLSGTLAYWEGGPAVNQGQPIPVYELTVEFTYRDRDENQNPVEKTTEDVVYVPSDTVFMAPVARILDAPTSVRAGSELTLTAADATKTLKELGIADLDFVLGYAGATGTYTYDWYLNSVAPENKITDKNTGDGLTKISFDAPASPSGGRDFLDVLLVVTDTDSPDAEASTATAQIRIPIIYLPTIKR